MTKENMAIRRAKKIANATTNDKDKCKAVHAWHEAIKVMLNG